MREVNRAVNADQLRSDEAPPMSPSGFASYWGVHINTVYRDIRKGALRAYRLPGGRLRIRRSDAFLYGRPTD